MKPVVAFLLVFVFLGGVIFMLGYHAVDTAYNMKSIGSNSDINYFGTNITADNLYREGISAEIFGFVMAIVFLIVFGGVRSA